MKKGPARLSIPTDATVSFHQTRRSTAEDSGGRGEGEVEQDEVFEVQHAGAATGIESSGKGTCGPQGVLRLEYQQRPPIGAVAVRCVFEAGKAFTLQNVGA